MNKLGEAGCTDALVGLDVAGQICLDFVREVSNADQALQSALEAVKRALPEAKLIEASWDVAGLAEGMWQ